MRLDQAHRVFPGHAVHRLCQVVGVGTVTVMIFSGIWCAVSRRTALRGLAHKRLLCCVYRMACPPRTMKISAAVIIPYRERHMSILVHPHLNMASVAVP